MKRSHLRDLARKIQEAARDHVARSQVSEFMNHIDNHINALARIEELNCMTDRDPLLVAKQATHGEFKDNASVSQGIKNIYRHSPGWGQLEMIERETMDQIALKFSRILSGKSMSREHWEDVVGYGNLVLERCK